VQIQIYVFTFMAVFTECESNMLDHWWWKNGRSLGWSTVYSSWQ